MPAAAVVMNVFYTGLGIARSLGEQGVEVIGLTSQRGIYGNFTRYARTVFCPDSRTAPTELLPFLLDLGRGLRERAVIFPTRDDDVIFLDRFRGELAPYFSIVAPESGVLRACLDKFETYQAAVRAGVPSPKCCVIESPEDVSRVGREIGYPCVLKPVSSHEWRKGRNWEIVGARKAICVSSEAELAAEYGAIAAAEKRALVQQWIPGNDQCLLIAACYVDRNSRYLAGFQAQKLVQAPEGLGTGCIVQSVERPELVEPTARLLENMQFTGVAEVEYKWDAAAREYKLIEINPRPWDQHRLGNAAGIDLIYMAYREHAGLPLPPAGRARPGHKWIAEDTFVPTALQLAWRRDARLWTLLRHARGRRLPAIWSIRDPLPFLAYATTRFIPGLLAAGVRWIWAALKRSVVRKPDLPKKGLAYERHVES